MIMNNLNSLNKIYKYVILKEFLVAFIFKFLFIFINFK